MFAYISYGSVNTSLGRQAGLGWGMWVFFVALIAVSIWMVVGILMLASPPKKK
jgi:hypothetical protein